MHGLGNDFIVIDGLSQRVSEVDFSKEAVFLCDRNFGIGADGVILVLPSTHSDFKMSIFNADGSEPQMCGNGIRCFARFVYENSLTDKVVFSVETLAGVIVPSLVVEDGKIQAIEVDMGLPILERGRIPILGEPKDKPVIHESLSVDGKSYPITCVSMGNPHCVTFVEDLKRIALNEIGPKFEHHPSFPERTNTEFVQIISRSEAGMLVWERGSGATLACGTGACAVLVAGVLNNLLDRKALIHLPGGDLIIEWQEDDRIMMTGPAETVFKGEIQL